MKRDKETIQRLFDTYGWLLENFGGFKTFALTKLVLPTREFFPVQAAQGPELAEEIFALVKAHAGMADWACRLEMEPVDEMGTLL